MADFGIIAWVAVYYELAIVLVLFFWVILSIRKYVQKKNELILLLVLNFMFYSLGIFFSLVSKLINAIWGGVPYEGLGSQALWWIARLQAGRFAFVFVVIASIIAYIFKVQVFGSGDYNKKQKYFLFVYSSISIIFLIFVYEFNVETERANQLYEIIAFGLMLFLMIIVYIPFIYRSRELYKRINEKVYKKKVISLNLMGWGFIMIFICFVLDRVMLIVFNWAYSIFYFLAWSCAVFAIITAYFGYLKPESS